MADSSSPHDGLSLFDVVRNSIAKVKRIPEERIKIESTFEELGLDSLDAMEVLFEVEEQTDLDIPDTAMRTMTRVSEVVNGLEKLRRGESLDDGAGNS